MLDWLSGTSDPLIANQSHYCHVALARYSLLRSVCKLKSHGGLIKEMDEVPGVSYGLGC